MREIEIIISADGESASIDMIGWEGQGCSEFAKKFTEVLGEVSESIKKSEYHEETQEQKNEQQQRI